MFDIGWSEMGVIAIVTLVVMGPKELPTALRSFAYWIKQARGLAREFQGGIDQLIREADLEDAKKKLQATTSHSINREIEKVIDPDRSLQQALTAQPGSAEASTAPASPPATGAAPAAGASAAAEGTLPAPAATPRSAEVTPFPGTSLPASGGGGLHGGITARPSGDPKPGGSKIVPPAPADTGSNGGSDSGSPAATTSGGEAAVSEIAADETSQETDAIAARKARGG
jgi:sec-independent protein translocase protein TatB